MQLSRVAAGTAALLAIASLAACSSGNASAGGAGDDAAFEPRTLIQASFIAQESMPGSIDTQWMDEVTERTDGAITFETNYASTLCGATDMIACVGDGRADLGLISPQFDPGKFPLSVLDATPFQMENSQQHAAVWNSLKETPEITAEYEAANLKELFNISPDLQLLGTAEPITDISDIEGLDIRTPGSIAGSIQALGANPVSLGSDELYEALQRGVIDGLVTTADVITTSKVYEVVKYYYNIGSLIGPFNTTPVVMNLDTWNSLEPGVQEIMNEVSAEVSGSMVEITTPLRDAACTELADNATIEALEDSTGWAEEQAPLALEAWQTNYETVSGNDPSSFVDQYLAAIDQQRPNFADLPSTAFSCVSD